MINWSAILDFKMFSKKNLIRIGANTLLGIILIYFWLQFVDLDHLVHDITNINPLAVVIFPLCLVCSLILKALRFKILLGEYKISASNIIFLSSLSQLLSFSIPLRVGEITKGVYISTQYKVPFKKTIIWVLMDRFIDFWMVVFLALILLLIVPTNLPENIRPTLIVLVVLLTVGTGLVLGAPEVAKKLAVFISRFLVVGKVKKIFIQLSEFIIDTASFLNKGFLKNLLVLTLTITALLLDALAWFTLFRFLGGDHVNYIVTFLGTLMSALTYLIPAAPGYVGSAEASGLAVFNLGLGLDKNLVTAATVINHGLTLLTIMIFGLTSLYLLKFDLSLVWKKLRGQED